MTTKVTLRSNGDTITTTCAGVSSHGADEATVHGLSKKGKDFADQHSGQRIAAKTKYGEYYKVNEITTAPLP